MSSLLELLKAKKAEISAASGDRMKTIKPLDGSGRYRILGSWRGENQQFWHDFGQHFIKNASKKIAAIYVCTEKTFGKPCAVCQTIEQGMGASSDDFTAELLKEARSSSRILVNAIHLDSAKPNEVQILELSPTCFGAFLNIMEQYEDAEQSLFDAMTGRDVIISRTGAGLQTKYTVMAAVKPSALPAGVMDRLHNLDEYVQQESAAQQLRALTSVRAVTGMLTAPPISAHPGLPAAAAGAAVIDEDPYAVAPPPVRAARPVAAAPAAAAEQPWDDVEVKEPAVAKAPPAPAAAKPAAKPMAPKPAPAPAPAAESTGDDEMDALLASLG